MLLDTFAIVHLPFHSTQVKISKTNSGKKFTPKVDCISRFSKMNPPILASKLRGPKNFMFEYDLDHHCKCYFLN